ncbi:tyrosine-type recombinase/integrase [Streptomyces sp. NPDC058469]|uniref:tyrosine-type recombinase/integrase n=1 Tax=Streptomyces sp. NPDC058469 TaxID=3346514 RepID=UPI00364ABA34
METYPPGDKYAARTRRRDCIGPWQARYRDPSGKQKSKNYPISEGGKRAAEAFLDDVRSRVRRREYGDPKRGQITVAQWWAMWWPAQPKKAVATVNRKESSWRVHIEPKWGDWRLCDLEYIALQQWLTSEVVGYHTRRKVLELLNQMLRSAVKDGKRIPFNPAAEVELDAAPKKDPEDTRPPTREQCRLLRERIPWTYRPLVVFLEETGLRWGEATGLRWAHVDLEGEHLKVKEVLSDDKGKLFRKAAPKSVAGFRTVPLTPEAIEAVRTMAARFKPTDVVSPLGDGRTLHEEELVFRGPNGGAMSRHNFRRMWIPAIQASGLAREVRNEETGRTEWWPRVHDLRHVFATRLKDLGIPEKDVQTVMGHDRGSKVTWLYQHSAEDVAAQVLTAMVPPKDRVRMLRAV